MARSGDKKYGFIGGRYTEAFLIDRCADGAYRLAVPWDENARPLADKCEAETQTCNPLYFYVMVVTFNQLAGFRRTAPRGTLRGRRSNIFAKHVRHFAAHTAHTSKTRKSELAAAHYLCLRAWMLDISACVGLSVFACVCCVCCKRLDLFDQMLDLLPLGVRP
jgi:hypothetical protein